MFRLLVFLLLLSSSLFVNAQCKVDFYFYSNVSNTPLVAEIFSNGIQLNPSNTDVRFSYEHTCGQHSVFEIRAVGYKNQQVELINRTDTMIDIFLEPISLTLPDLEVLASRFPGNVLPAVSKLSGSDLQEINTGKDIPYLLESIPSVFSTSDAGNQTGYTGLRIRGSDQTRINVTINGVPVNDAESHNVFWVDLPDLASSVDQIQIQRGVGTSSYGAGSFGANISIITKPASLQPYLTTAFSGGSFNSFKKSVLFGTGLINKHFSFEGRWSGIDSDGYIDRAYSHLSSLYGNLNYHNRKNTIRLIAFSGDERTYQSWYGVPESVLSGDVEQMNAYADRNGLSDTERQNLLGSGRTYNYYQYKDQTDNYRQSYFQLIYSSQLSDNLLFTSVAHLTRGKGYYEEWKPADKLADYGLLPIVAGQDTISEANIVRKRWLDNYFYGMNAQLKYETTSLFLSGGLTAYQYDGNHFGRINWIDNYPGLVPGFEYYKGKGIQDEFSFFGKLKYGLTQNLDVLADLQYRLIRYNAYGTNNDLQEFVIYRQYNFFNPKIACSYRPANGWYINASVGRSNSQPFRDDFINATPGRQPKSEQLTDYELEIQKSGKNWSAIASFYYMKYKDQLILTGELNDVGAAVRTNVAESYGRGVELQLSWQPFPFLQWTGNGSFSSNIIRAFDYLLYDYDNGGEVLETFVNTPISFSPSTILYSDIRLNHKKWSLDVTAKYIGQQYLDNTGSVERAIDPYTVINSTLSWKTKIFSNSVLQLSGQIFNLADLKYSSNGYTYSYLYGGLVTENFYYPQAGRHFMLSCKIDW